MILGIDPKVDYAFKHLFGREETRPILIDVLNSILSPPPGHHIRDIELLNPFNPKEAVDDKMSILDIKARDQSGRQFNVEMQMVPIPITANEFSITPANSINSSSMKGRNTSSCGRRSRSVSWTISGFPRCRPITSVFVSWSRSIAFF